MFQFPNSPLEGQIYQPPGGPTYMWRSPVWEAAGEGHSSSHWIQAEDLSPGMLAFDTRAAAQAASIPADITQIRLTGDATLLDGKGGTYVRTWTEGNTDQFTDAGGAIWYRSINGHFRSWSKLAEQPNWRGGISAVGAILVGDLAGGAAAAPSPNNKNVYGFGHGALANATADTRNVIAIGTGVMSNGTPGRHNLGIGDNALAYVTGDDTQGDRNIGIGSLAGHFITSGRQNVIIGRDAAHGLTTGFSNTCVGYRAGMVGANPIGLSGDTENQISYTSSYTVAVGYNCLSSSGGVNNTGVGATAGLALKGNHNVIIGHGAALALDSNVSDAGKIVTSPALAATFSQTGTVITVAATASGVIAGNKVGISFNTGANSAVGKGSQWLTVASVVNANSFTLASPISMTDTGSATIDAVETATVQAKSDTNVVIGQGAADISTNLGGSVVIGWQAGRSMSGDARNVAVGRQALSKLLSAPNNTAVGHICLNTTIAGADNTAFTGCSGLGFGARVSANNQVQLGASGTTTYAYGAVQDRSDERDKADIQDTLLGLDFIMALRPVDYRWDMRDDYIETVEEEIDGELTTRTVAHPKDGSKKRNRLHHGLIAQEVMAVTDQFGGVQDHKVNGGEDVLSLGYQELIAPLIKAVQQLKAEVEALKAQLAA